MDRTTLVQINERKRQDVETLHSIFEKHPGETNTFSGRSFKGLVIFPNYWKVFRGNKEISLSSNEYRLIFLLTEHPGWVFTKEQIYRRIYGEWAEGDIDNIIYCLIRSLRKKLEPDSRHPRYILTVRGIGYKFEALSEE